MKTEKKWILIHPDRHNVYIMSCADLSGMDLVVSMGMVASVRNYRQTSHTYSSPEDVRFYIRDFLKMQFSQDIEWVAD